MKKRINKIRFKVNKAECCFPVLNYDRQDIAESYLCRPENLKDYGVIKDAASAEIELESWGRVRLTAFAYEAKADNCTTMVALTDDAGNILYGFRPKDPGGCSG